MRFQECLRFSDESSLFIGDIIIRPGEAFSFLRKEVLSFPKTTYPFRPRLISFLEIILLSTILPSLPGTA